ncbi:heavy-metal-associated domain-containing protein [Methylomarinum vadi]|uniref:heavy-metal-associated domain-containing protein n=1 Tax=Methylomarinum vadi TaxID=438855 RepID=UPI0004DF7406|nr:heavy metal-associated domain-containing protein [Methylomarinum vadi]
MTSESIEYKNFRLVKTWENRVKVIAPALQGEPERAYIFQILLNKRPEIQELLITVKSGEIDIKFAAESLSREQLLLAMDNILGNVAKKSSAIDKKQLPGNPEEIELRVGGMSCPACALLIEMALKKDEQVVDASADLDSKLVRVFGSLSREQVIERIEKLGYKHIGEER